MGGDEPKNSKFCVFAILVTQLPIAFLTGLNLTALNSSTPAVKVFINSSYVDRYGKPPEEYVANLILALAQSLLIWGSLVGALMVKPVLRKFSRKGAVLVTHCFNALSVIMTAPIAKYGKSYESLIIGRLIAGISRGLGLSIAMVVVAEISCRRRLGLFQSPFMLVAYIGTVISAGLGHPKVLGSADLWMWIMFVPAVPSLVYFMSFPWIPNTPVFLVKKGKKVEALETMRKLRTGNEVEEELKIIQDEIEEESNASVIPLKTMLTTPRLRLQFVTAIVVHSTPQLLGVQAILMYSDSLLLQAGVGAQNVTFATMAMFLQIVVAYAIYVPMQRKFGTKKIFVGGMVAVTFGYIMFILANALHKAVPWMSNVALFFMCAIMFGIQLGPSLAMLSLPAELTTAASRPTVAFYSGCLFWIMGGIIALVFPYAVASWNAFAYIPFAVLSLALIPFSISLVPDVHKRSAAQIQNSFRKKSKKSMFTLFNPSRRLSQVDDSRTRDNEAFEN